MGRTYKQDLDRASIEELAATLESKIGSDDAQGADDEVALADRRLSDASPEVGASALPPVLIAHVDPRSRADVRGALERHFRVLEAQDGEDAWEMLSAHRDVRVLLTGTRLPRLDGVELIRRLRRPNGPAHLVGLPIMVYADAEDPATKQTVLLAGANDYLLADTEPGALLARVQARNRLFEQSRRAMNLTGTMPTARTRRPEVSNGAAAPAPATRGEMRARGSSDRPIWVEARGGGASTSTPRGWAERLYRVSSTTTITLTATVLVILAITLILLLNQTPQRPQSVSVGRLDAAPPTTEQAAAGDEAPRAAERSVETPVAPPAQPEVARDHAAPPPAPRPEPASRPTPPAVSGDGRGEAPAAASSPERAEAPTARRAAGPESRTSSARASVEEAPAPRSAPPARTEPPVVAAAPSREAPPKAPVREAPTPSPADDTTAAAREPQPIARAPAATDAARIAREESPRPADAEGPAAPTPPAAAEAGLPAEAPVAAATSPIAASPATRPAPPRLSRDELSTLLQRFVSVYEAGDIEQFMALLADNVQTNDRVTRQAVRDDYARLFRTTDLRQMRIETMNWDVQDDQAHGWGEFEVRVRRQGDATVHHYQGSITVQVRKAAGRPRIERLYHSERRAGR